MKSSLELIASFALALAGGGVGCSAGSAPASATAMDAGTDAEIKPTVASNGCPINSGFAGDDGCLAAPSPDAGFQLRYGPKSYTNPKDVAAFVLPPNGEQTDCYFLKTPNDTDVYVGGYEFSLRPGSHHLNANIIPKPQADGFATCQGNEESPGPLGNAIKPRVEELRDMAPENVGLVAKVPAHSQASINLHFINAGVKPALREAWLNYMYMDPSQVKGFRGNIVLQGGFGFQILPGTSKTYSYACSPDRPARILSMTAHMHAHNNRLTAWKVSGGQATLVYENYSWANPTEFHYDSVHQNATPDRAKQVPGGSSGQLVLQPTDTLQWECAIDNTSNVTLMFRNEVYTGEMCELNGVMVPADDPMKPDDFMCTLN